MATVNAFGFVVDYRDGTPCHCMSLGANAVRCQACLQGSGGTMQIMTKNRATPCRFLVGDDFAAWGRIYLEPLECTLLELFLQNSVDKPLSVVFDLY